MTPDSAALEKAARIADRAAEMMAAQGSLSPEREFVGAATVAREIAASIRALASTGAPQGWQLVPVEPTEPMWSGLARAIMLAWDLGAKTPRRLFQHLERTTRAEGGIPRWLRDEPEMQALDHVTSKGTRCVILYRAMLSAAPTPPSAEEGEVAA